MSGRLKASDVTGHTCRPRLAGAHSLSARIGATVARVWQESLPCRCVVAGRGSGNARNAAARRLRRGRASSAGQPRKGARERSDQCGAGGAQRGVATSPPVMRAGGWGNSGALPKRASGATRTGGDAGELPARVDAAR